MISEVRRPPTKRVVVIAAILLILFVLFASARFYTDLLWFDEVGLSSVLWTSLRTQFAVGLIVGLATGAIVWVNLKIAERLSPAYVPERASVGGRPDPLAQYRAALLPLARWIRLAVAGGLGLVAGLGASTAWQIVLLWANRVSFGRADEQFGKDIGFYVFELPFLDQVGDWIWFALVGALLLTLGVYYFYGAIRPELGWRGVLPGALAHVSVLLGLLALVKAGKYWLGTYALNFSPRGTVTGASYTDVTAQLPALRLLAIISIISAVLFLVNIRVRRLSLPLAAVVIWLLTSVLAGAAWPFAVQRFSVEPQEPQREKPYIQRNLDATREGFALSGVEVDDFEATNDLSAEEVTANEAMLQNVRLWDPSVLQRAYAQLQAIRTYYKFIDVDIDRYLIGDEMRQVLLSARELSLDDPVTSSSWQNRHLQYTHGFGLVASLANEATSAGQPSFLVRDVPGTAVEEAEELQVEQPRIYYGESFGSDEYSIVRSEQSEIDYPLGENEVQRSNYEGRGGVSVGNLFRRVAFAVREGDPNLVLSGLISSESKILIYRNVRERVRRAAPFLSLDSDPYLAVIEGRLVWILDAYTSSPWYPYSQRFEAGDVIGGSQEGSLDGTVNYVRNSVKVTIDAYDGNMLFHVVDEDDPLIQAWRNAFPDLFTDEEPSEDLRAHFRYPEDLFKLQSDVYRRYHVLDPLNFYAGEDTWQVPRTPTVGSISTTAATDAPISPVYLLFRLPGEEEQEFVLSRPFTPTDRPNMISLLLARSDPEHYGEIVSLQFPRSGAIAGPQQVDNLVNQDTTVSRLISLLGRQGSTIQFGSLVNLPIEDSILYVQPLFIEAEGGGIPELKKIVLVLGEEVVIADTFDSALTQMFGIEEPGPGPEPEPTPSPTATPGEPGAGNEELESLIARAGRVYQQAQQALEDGDFARYGRLIERLGRLLERAEQLSGR